MEEKKTLFFVIPFLSFVPTKYKQLIKNSAGKLFGAILVVFLILGIVGAINTAHVLKEVFNEVETACPDFSVINGEFNCDQRFEFADQGVYLIIDDTISDITESDIKAKITEGYYESVLFVGQEEIGTYSQGRIQIVRFSDLGLTNFTKDSLFGEMIPSLLPLIEAFVIAYRLLCMIGYYLATLVMGLLTLLISSTMNKNLSFKECFRITLLAKIPVYVLLYIVELFITIRLGLHLLIGATLILVYTGVIVRMFEDQAPMQNIESN